MRLQLSLAFLAVVAFSAPAFAEDTITISGTPDQIRTQQAQLRQAIERKSGNYSQFSEEERQAIFARQDDVLAVLGDKTSIDELGTDGKMRLANAMEAVDAAVNRAEDNRLICERIKPIGSNRPEKKCMTVGQRRKLREDAQRGGLKMTP